MTLIDFGAVGHINMFENNPDIHSLLDIFMMALFYNYDEVLDKMTVLLNNKCPETQIDPNTTEYSELKKQLYNHRLTNIRNDKEELEKENQYRNNIFSNERIDSERSESANLEYLLGHKVIESVYTYLEHKPQGKEIIVENTDVVPVFTETRDDMTQISFAQVLEIIIKFYAKAGINIAIKFSDFYELQKAYVLLLGVLHKVHYNSYRIVVIMRKAIINWKHFPKLFNISTVWHVYNKYIDEYDKFDKIMKNLTEQERQTVENQLIENQLVENQLVENQLVENQKGGRYHHKYLKYKTKYLKYKS